jgi:hypothetical protein
VGNVQITGDELTCVWIDNVTGEIAGFAPAGFAHPCTLGSHPIPLYHAWERDRYYQRFRLQEAEKFEREQYEKFMREAPVRKNLRDKLKARRNQVGPLQRADIDRGLKMLDALEARLVKKREGAALVEMYDATKRQEDIALESPAYQAVSDYLSRDGKPPLLLTAGS